MLGNQLGKQKGCHGRGGYVDQGISKENGGKELAGPSQCPNDQLSTARSLSGSVPKSMPKSLRVVKSEAITDPKRSW